MEQKLSSYVRLENMFASEYLTYPDAPNDCLLKRRALANIILIHQSYSRGILALLGQKDKVDYTVSCGTILRSALENFAFAYSLTNENDEVLKKYLDLVDYPTKVGKDKFRKTLNKGKHKYVSQLSEKKLGERLDEINVPSLITMYDLLCDYTHGNPWVTSIQPNKKASFDFGYKGLVIIAASLVGLSGIRRVFDPIKATEITRELLRLVDLEESMGHIV